MDKKYVHFHDSHRKNVINNTKTNKTWINYLGNEDVFSLISTTAGGYSLYKDAKFRRITRYRYNNVPMENDGRYSNTQDSETIQKNGRKHCQNTHA